MNWTKIKSTRDDETTYHHKTVPGFTIVRGRTDSSFGWGWLVMHGDQIVDRGKYLDAVMIHAELIVKKHLESRAP